MSGLYSGSTPKYLTRIRDEAGVQLDPEDIDQILEVRIWIYNAISGTIVAKFYLNTLPTPSTGWRQASVKEIITGDKRVLFTLTAAETSAAPVNKNEIQIEITIPDADFDDNKRVIIKTGRFSDIRPAQT
jgi:hypothetical protein